jgi:hypothetical protein
MDAQYKEFLSNIAEVDLLSRQVKSTTERELELMFKSHQSLVEKGMERHSCAHHNMFYPSLVSGEAVFYDHMYLDFDRLVKNLFNHRNKHYLWLLAEAFEYFEDLVELIYAHIGHKEPNFWSLKETKGETPESLVTKPFDWYLQKSQSNKNLHAKLDCIRKRFPVLAATEKSNYFGIDLRFTICLIEMLRHIVVHNNGRIMDISKFVARTFERAGMANNGNYDSLKLQQINDFVSSDGKGYRIVMLEIHQSGTPFHFSRIGAILNWILAYADYIYGSLIRPTYFSKD